MNMHLRSYRPSDLAEIAVLLYDTVHTVTIKDNSAAQRNAWASGKVNSEQWNNVGRGHVPAACRNYRPSIGSFMRTVCRFADGWDMSQPYIGCFVYHGAFSRMDCEGACARGNLVQAARSLRHP